MPAAARQPRSASARFDSLEQEAYLNLWRTYDRLRAFEDEVFAAFGLTAQQYNALRLLKAARPEPVPTLAIADRMVSRAPDITRMIDRLEQSGWATRERSSQDRRTVLVGITPAGLELLDKIAGPLRECHERQLGHVPAASLKQLIELLHTAREPHEPDGGQWK
jgi:DNA-binding MarR family transcriptional regulator